MTKKKCPQPVVSRQKRNAFLHYPAVPAFERVLWIVDLPYARAIAGMVPKATKDTNRTRTYGAFVALTAELHGPALDPAPAARALIFARALHRPADAAHVRIGAGCGKNDAEPGVIFGRFAQRHVGAARKLRLDRTQLVRRPIDVGSTFTHPADARTGGQAGPFGADHHRSRRQRFAPPRGGRFGGGGGGGGAPAGA